MARSTKDSWLEGPGDLKTAEVEDVPKVGESVLVQGLSAAHSNQAASEAQKLVIDRRGGQSASVDTARMEILQFAHGCVEPKFTVEQAEKIAERYGPAFRKAVDKIDELSGVDKDSFKEANDRFRGGDEGEARGDVALATGPTSS